MTRLLSALLVVTLATVQSQHSGLQSHYECVDNLNDFDSQNWDASSAVGYAQSTKELPPILRHKLTGHGIFYFVGGQEANQALIQWAVEFSHAQPVFLYIKYYGHLLRAGGGHQGMYVIPAKGQSSSQTEGHLRNLKSTREFAWHEELVELSVNELHKAGLEVGAYNLEVGDYFLVEKLILVQGVQIESVDQVKKFCGPSSWPTNVTPTRTETAFLCQEPGYFADPKDCSRFHLCQPDHEGRLCDSSFTCPEQTVWCQTTLRCENPESCPFSAQI